MKICLELMVSKMRQVKRILFVLCLFLAFLGFGEIVQASQQGRNPVKVTVTSVFHDGEGGIIENELDSIYATKFSVDDKIGELSGYEFAFWVVNGKYRGDLRANHEFRITDKTQITAIFRPTDKFAVLFLDANGDVINYHFVASGGNAIEPTILPSKPGHRIADENWDKSLNIINGNTVFYLQYERLESGSFSLNVNGVEQGTYAYNEVVTVNAAVQEGDKFFSHWQIGNRIVSNQPTYSFTMFQNTEITAVYSDVEKEDLPLVTLSDKLNLRDGYDSYMGQFYVPEGYEVIEYGIITSTTEGLIDLATADKNRIEHNAANFSTNEFLTSISSTSYNSVRAYLVCEYQGNLITVYNEVVEEAPNYVYAEDLFFSYYIEGSSNNKAIAIFNGTGQDVDLLSYSVKLYANGSSAPGNTEKLSGILSHGEVFILVNGSANAEILALGIKSAVANFNGDDALELCKGSIVIDSFGQAGYDPGTEWSSNGVSTVDMSLVRKPNIITGRTASTSVFDPSIEWTALSKDSTEGIKNHIMDNMGPEIGIEENRTKAINDLNNYFDLIVLDNYSLACQEEITNLIVNGIDSIELAKNIYEINNAVTTAKTSVSEVLTKDQEYNQAKTAIALPTGDIVGNIDMGTSPFAYVTYVWRITPEGIIDGNGVFTAPEVDTELSCEVDILIDGVKHGETLTSTALAKASLTNADLYNYAISHIDSVMPLANAEIIENIIVPGNHPDFSNVAYTWGSSHIDIISSEGIYTAPAVDTEVTLTVTINIDGEVYGESKGYIVIAKKKENKLTYFHDFETKNTLGYSATSVTLSDLLWKTKECYYSNPGDANDRLSATSDQGLQMLRMRGANTAYFELGEFYSGITAFVFDAKYYSSSHSTALMKVSKMVEGGVWQEVQTITLTDSYKTYNIGINEVGNVKVRIDVTSKSANIDNIKFYK